MCSFFSIAWHPQKNIDQYLSEIEIAKFTKTAEIQLDEQITRLNFFSEIRKELAAKKISWSIKTTPQSLPKISEENFAACMSLNIHFEKTEQIIDLLENQKSEKFNFILTGTKNSDYLKLPVLFPNKKNIFLAFEKFNPQKEASLTVSEVKSVLQILQKKFPAFQVHRFPFSEPIPTKCDLSDLEGYKISPLFSFNTPDANPVFSFIIPTYNSSYFLLNVITHIKSQEYPTDLFEVIVVDDGGNDGSDRLVRSYLQGEETKFNIKYFHWPKPQPRPADFFRAGQCRNLGATHAQGKYLVFLDSDILIPRNFLKDLSDRFQKQDVIQYIRKHIVHGKSNAYVSFDRVTEKDLYIEESHYWKPFFESPHWPSMPFYWKYTCTYCLCLKTNDFFASGRFHRNFMSYGYEDTDLGYRLSKMGLKFHLATLPTLHLTKENSKTESAAVLSYKRHKALSKTAKTFFLLSLDPDVYRHFIVYMGGESRWVRWYMKTKRSFIQKLNRSNEL